MRTLKYLWHCDGGDAVTCGWISERENGSRGSSFLPASTTAQRMPHPVHGERPPGVMLASPAPSDESGTDSEPELSFYYTTDDRGQFVRRSKTPTITSATTLPTQPPSSSSSPVSSTEGSSPVTGSSTARPTRGRSESNVMSGSASMGGVRPFSRVASAAAAVPVATGRLYVKPARHALCPLNLTSAARRRTTPRSTTRRTGTRVRPARHARHAS